MRKADYLQSPLLLRAGFSHAFFTRCGGVSEGPYSSLNFSVGVGDEPERVSENLARAAAALGVAPGRVLFLSQVHGIDAQTVDGSESLEQVLALEGDALLSRTETVACGVRTADCVPILLADAGSGAVAAVHAGWRGLVRGVIGQAVNQLRLFTPAAGPILAAIGPHISIAAFEVSESVAAELEACSDAEDIVVRATGKKPHVSLNKIARAQLRRAHIADSQIDEVDGCTVLEPARFFSYRRDGKVGGRHLSAIVARR